jgi:hypothetical protein
MNPPAMTRRPKAMWIVRLALRRPYTFVLNPPDGLKDGDRVVLAAAPR